MKNKAYIHLGAHKTGTTFIQRNLWSNKELIESKTNFKIIEPQKNKIYLKARMLFQNINAGLKTDYNFSYNLFKKLLNDHKDKDIIISDETFMGHSNLQKSKVLYPKFEEVISNLKLIFKNYDLKIILGVRKTPEFIQSCFFQTIKEGSGINIVDFINKINLNEFSWLKLIKFISPLKFKIIFYEDLQRSSKDFFIKFTNILDIYDEDLIYSLKINEQKFNPQMNIDTANFLIQSKNFFLINDQQKTYVKFCNYFHRIDANHDVPNNNQFIFNKKITEKLNSLYDYEYKDILQKYS